MNWKDVEGNVLFLIRSTVPADEESEKNHGRCNRDIRYLGRDIDYPERDIPAT
jgi:hypothetical protein